MLAATTRHPASEWVTANPTLAMACCLLDPTFSNHWNVYARRGNRISVTSWSGRRRVSL